MKVLVLVALFILATAAQAADEPLLTKSSGGGLTHPQYQRAESCALYAGRVEITEVYGTVISKEVRKVTVSASIREALEEAAKEEVKETENGICDAPGTYVAAGKLEIFSSGGCGSPKRVRTGPYSDMLRQLIGQYCPLNYFFP